MDKVTRLDKIITDNVGASTHYKESQQMVIILQDISETLAMIYDKMCEKEGEESETNLY